MRRSWTSVDGIPPGGAARRAHAGKWPRIGPRGLEFARARVEMKAVESVLHLERAEPAKMRNMIPDHVWALVAPYGIKKPDQPSAR